MGTMHIDENLTGRGHNNNEETNIKSYFEHFHPSFPLLHRPTFALSSAPKLLVKAAAVIGSLFSSQPEARAHWRREMWEADKMSFGIW